MSWTPTGVLIRDAKKLYGHAPADEFGPLEFKTVGKVWIDRGQSRPTVNENVGRLQRLFKWAASEELVDAWVYQFLRTVFELTKERCSSREPEPIKHRPQVTAELKSLHRPCRSSHPDATPRGRHT